jgi:cytochrome b561
MSSDKHKYGLAFTLFHWLLALLTLVLLGLGWRVQFLPMSGDERGFVDEIHISLGFTLAAVLVIVAALQIHAHDRTPPRGKPSPIEIAGKWLHGLAFLLLAVMVVSGYLRLAFAGVTVEFWGAPLPVWGEPNEQIANLSAHAHKISAFALALVVLAHSGVAVAKALRPATTTSVAGFPSPLAADSYGDRIARDFARNMSLFGWIGFWLQFIFAFLCALLLQIATAGRMLSAVSANAGDAIYWSGCGLFILLLTCGLSFYYTRKAPRLAAAPHYYFGQISGPAPWYLSAGIFLGVLGVLASFGGVALSIVLLIAKTVSQPPGIAITDPTKIIRALDIFILLMSFLLLMAHFIGFGVSLWLRVSVANARLKYRKAHGRGAMA